MSYACEEREATGRHLGVPRPRAIVFYGAMIAGTVILFLLIDACGRGLAVPESGSTAAKDGAPVGGAPNTLAQLLVTLTTVLVVGRLLGMLFRTLGQPPVIGEIVGGILLGPSLLGRAWPAAAAVVLPTSIAPPLGLIAQLGVILYMFLVGVELNLGILRVRAHAAVAISHASIIVPFLLGAGLALVLYPKLSNGSVSFTSFALFIGASMSVTAFPVLARILTDRGMQSTPLGTIALGCAAVDDVTAWCLLAFVTGVARAKMGEAFLVLGLTAGYIGFMIIVARPIAGRLLGRFDERRMNQGVFTAILAALLLSSLATEAIGIHAVFGAFLLGAVISHDGTLAPVLFQKLNDVVTLLLLPAFFAFTGMRTRVDLVSGLEQWLLCGLIVLVATAGKFGGTLISARFTGMGWRESAELGALMNTRGLVELIVLNIGIDMKIISPTLFSMMVVMAVVTTIATTPALRMFARRAAGPDRTGQLSAQGPAGG